MIEECVKSATEQEKTFLPESRWQYFLRTGTFLNHLLHQLSVLLDPGPGQGEVHHARSPPSLPENTQHFTAWCSILNSFIRTAQEWISSRHVRCTLPELPQGLPVGCICSVMAATRPVLNSHLILECGSYNGRLRLIQVIFKVCRQVQHNNIKLLNE